ncbi:MAG: hypothetical protein KDD89_07330, partial [Anaerolineales bacterium]|nr:hypothetical protein [Anaerolineales bacterium]
FAVDGAAQVGQSALASNVFVDGGFVFVGNNYYDATGPRLTSMTIDDGFETLLPPFANNNLYSGTITFEGTAVDASDFGCPTPACEAFTGINGYQISFDGGLTWDTMGRAVNPLFNNTHHGRVLPYDWTIPSRLDATTIPVKIRATDYAGNSQAFVYTVTVDTGAPRIVGTINVDSGPALGTHVDQLTLLDFSWAEPTDASGEVTMLGNFGQVSTNLAPEFVRPEPERLDAQITEGGEWYAVVGAEDEVGNIDWIWVGPWYAGQVKDPDAPSGLPWGSAIQSVNIDGLVDLEYNEYVVENEWLDTDPRGFTPLSLYNAWSAGESFIGVVGGNWETDGAFLVYYDLENGGTTTPISATGSITLPFAADYALTFNGTVATSWRFNGTDWEDDFSYLDYAVDENSQGLEIGRYFEDYWNLEEAANHRMVAYALADDGNLWATFPRNNDLGGVLAYYYDWNVTPGSGNGDLLKLPTYAQLSDLAMVVNSNPIGSAPLTHGSVVTLSVSLFNLSETAADDVLLDVTGSTAVTYQAATGASCVVCPPAGALQLSVAEIAAGDTAVVTITAQLDADLTGLDAVSTTIALASQSFNNEVSTIVHQLDLLPPQQRFDDVPGNAINGTIPRILGSSDDRAGIGLARVEYSQDQVSWATASGTNEWVIELPSQAGSTAEVYVRSIDLYGQTSGIISQTMVLDDIAPVITPTVPALVGGRGVAYLTGIASDPAPANAQVASVEIRFNNETTWQTANLGDADANGARRWVYVWQLPLDDGVSHTYQYRATDYAGNVFTSTVYTTVVDRVAPALTLDTDLSGLTVENDILTGTVADGREVSSLNIAIYAITGSGTVTNTAITPNPDGSWSYDLNLDAGMYTIVLNASDGLNGLRVIGPLLVEVDDVVITNTLNITATLQGRTSHDVTHSLSFYEAGNTNTAVYSTTAVADTAGTFTLTNLPAGTYTVTLTPPTGYLSAVEVVTMPASGTVSVNFGELKNGDANGDNAVNILDLSVLAGAYNTTSG